MDDLNWIYMIEKMQEINLFSRMIIHRATKEYEIQEIKEVILFLLQN